MAERYRFNIVRMPGLENQTGWARLTGWMPRPLSGLLTAVFTGSPPRPAADDQQRIERLAQTAKEFPYDGFLHLELARQYMRQARANRRADPDLLRQALAYNQRAFETHFDIDAYNQMAWTHIELSEALARQDARQALEHYRAAIDGFERVLVLKPGDVDALEHLGAIYSSVATRTKKPDDWNRVIAYAERLLDEEHYNPNALYFLGLAYDNLDIKERAATYYSRAVRSANRIPAERLVWREQREAVITQLKKLGYSP